MHNTKIHLKGEHAYEDLLIRQHRKEVEKFLKGKGYAGYKIRYIMSFYDRDINRDNIIKVHTHNIKNFLTYFCSGRLTELYGFTDSKVYRDSNEVPDCSPAGEPC